MPALGGNAQCSSNNPGLKIRLRSFFRPDTTGGHARVASNYNRTVWPRHLMKKRRHQPGVTVIVGRGEPGMCSVRVSVNGDDGKAIVTGRAN